MRCVGKDAPPRNGEDLGAPAAMLSPVGIASSLGYSRSYKTRQRSAARGGRPHLLSFRRRRPASREPSPIPTDLCMRAFPRSSHPPRKLRSPRRGFRLFARFVPAKLKRNHFSGLAKSSGNGACYSSRCFQGGEIAKMILLKITALVLGAGMLVGLFSPPDFSPDFILAIVACFS